MSRPYVAVIAMNRLQRPWEALRLPLLVIPPDRRHADFQDRYGPGGRDPVRAHGRVARRPFMATRHPLFEAETLLAQVGKTFAELSSRSSRRSKSGATANGASACWRTAPQIGKVMEGFMERAAQGIRRRAADAKGQAAPISAKPSGAEKRDMALRYARLVAGSRTFRRRRVLCRQAEDAVRGDLHSSASRYNEDAGARHLKSDPQNERRQRPVPALRRTRPPSCSAMKKRNCCAGAGVRRNRPPPS